MPRQVKTNPAETDRSLQIEDLRFINRINLADSSVRYYGSSGEENPADGLPNDRVMALYVDHAQKVWMSTRKRRAR